MRTMIKGRFIILFSLAIPFITEVAIAQDRQFSLYLSYEPLTPEVPLTEVEAEIHRSLPMVFLQLRALDLEPRNVKRTGPHAFRFSFPEEAWRRFPDIVEALSDPPGVQFRLVGEDPLASRFPFPKIPSGHQWVKSGEGAERRTLIALAGESGFTNALIRSARLSRGASESPTLEFEVHSDLQQAFFDFTSANRGQRLAVVHDGHVISAPVLRGGIRESGVITAGPGEASNRRLERLARVLSGEGPPHRVGATVSHRQERRRIAYRVPGGTPVVHPWTGTAFPLTARGEARLLTAAREQYPHAPGVWFLYVRCFFPVPEEDKGLLTATVYYKPEEVRGRIRKGWAAYLMLHDGKRSLGRYIQVAPAGRLFGSRLGLPLGGRMPFAVKGDIPDDELVAVVDFARTGPKAPFMGKKENDLRKFRTSNPILMIEKKFGVFVMTTGVVRGRLDGHGQILRCRKEGNRYVAIGVWEWIS